MYSAEGDLQRTLNIAIRLTTYHHRYVPFCFLSCPSIWCSSSATNISSVPSPLSTMQSRLALIFRWYMDASYPSMVAHYLYKLGLVHGHAKIQYTLLSMVRTLSLQLDTD